MVLFQASKTTFKRVLWNQIPIENDDEHHEYDDDNGDNFDAYDDDNAMTLWSYYVPLSSITC